MKRLVTLCLIAMLTAFTAGCGAQHHQKGVGIEDGKKLTPGVVQAEIRKGMSQADVIQALGSPNIVTRDSSGKETYIWDKVSSAKSYSNSQNSYFLIIVGGSGGAGAVTSSQNTLTVIIKFVEGFADEISFHSSKF